MVVVAEARVGCGDQEAGGGSIIRGGVPARVQLLPEPGDLQVTAEAGLGTTPHSLGVRVIYSLLTRMVRLLVLGSSSTTEPACCLDPLRLGEDICPAASRRLEIPL